VRTEEVFSRMIAFFDSHTGPGGVPGLGGSSRGGGAAPFADPADAVSVTLALTAEVGRTGFLTRPEWTA
jgi:hypothetical protein